MPDLAFLSVFILFKNIIMKDIVLFWIPWAWKWTKAKKILENFENYVYLSTWEVYRALLNWWENAIGNYIKQKMSKWELIWDDLTIHLFRAYYSLLEKWQNMLLDGYPRTKWQIDDLIDFVKKENRQLIWIHLVIPDELAIKRMIERWREDDNLQTIKVRIKEYYEKTLPAIEYFSKHFDLVKIDSSREPDEVFEEIKKYIK